MPLRLSFDAQATKSSLASYLTHCFVAATLMMSAPANAAQTQCPQNQSWNPSMQMCMPQAEVAPESTAPQPKPQQRPISADSDASPTSDPQAAKSMVMADEGRDASPFMLQINQFGVFSHTTGPRGQSRVTGPGSWMLMYDRALTPQNRLSVSLMASPEQLTVGEKGTPQLLQTENIDNMHAHDTIMALECSPSAPMAQI